MVLRLLFLGVGAFCLAACGNNGADQPPPPKQDSAPIIPDDGQQDEVPQTPPETDAPETPQDPETPATPEDPPQDDADAQEGPRRVFQEGIDHLKDSEGFEPVAYNDVAMFCTIAYGHLIRRSPCQPQPLPVRFQGTLSEADGESLLRDDMQIAEGVVDKEVTVALDNHEFAALVSFTFNVGGANFRRSTLLKKLNQGDYLSVETELRRWIFAGGQAHVGLENRRDREIELFFTNRERPQMIMMKSAISPIDIVTGEEISNMVFAPSDEDMEAPDNLTLSNFKPRPRIELQGQALKEFVVKPTPPVKFVIPLDRRTIKTLPAKTKLPVLKQPLELKPMRTLKPVQPITKEKEE